MLQTAPAPSAAPAAPGPSGGAGAGGRAAPQLAVSEEGLVFLGDLLRPRELRPTEALFQARQPPHPSRTKWTRRVPHPVLIGHAASLPPY